MVQRRLEPPDPGTVPVAHLIKGLGRGGAERLLPQQIRAGGAGFSYTVGYFLPWKDALVPELERDGIAVRRFAARTAGGMLLRVPSVARWLRRSRIRLLHAHLPLAGVVGRLAGRLVGVPVVYSEHNLLERYHPWTRRAGLATWGMQRAVVAVSDEVAGSIARHAGGRVPVRVIRNGIEVPAAAEVREGGTAVRASLGIPPDVPVVGTVAVMRVQKRLDLWLEAARRIAEERPETQFLLVGDGPLRADTEAAATRLGLTRVHFPGLQEEVAPWLAALDLFLISSEFEGLPLAVLEAMAAGVPVVATAVGGIPEVVDPGRSGVLVPFGDPAALAAAVAGLLGDPERRRTLAAAGRRRVEEAFGVERMARELEALYREVLERPGG
jgi:glycosyltransferase involved in cell wall biosynthesis